MAGIHLIDMRTDSLWVVVSKIDFIAIWIPLSTVIIVNFMNVNFGRLSNFFVDVDYGSEGTSHYVEVHFLDNTLSILDVCATQGLYFVFLKGTVEVIKSF